ncbi:MAG: hypothetical protein M0C28_04630 [Candidatus Moduliflexus flocculans]|nr:hypothetical protein [Candidatus Moduliflexus flocculans]
MTGVTTSTDGKLRPFMKHLYLEYANFLVPKMVLNVGMIETLTFKPAEERWGYRSVAKTLLDGYRDITKKDILTDERRHRRHPQVLLHQVLPRGRGLLQRLPLQQGGDRPVQGDRAPGPVHAHRRRLDRRLPWTTNGSSPWLPARRDQACSVHLQGRRLLRDGSRTSSSASNGSPSRTTSTRRPARSTTSAAGPRSAATRSSRTRWPSSPATTTTCRTASTGTST